MKRQVLILMLLLLLCATAPVFSQSFAQLDTIKPPANLDNIHSRKLYSDSLTSSFLLFIRKNVKLHKHLHHTEHVYILDGEAEMVLGENKIIVHRGDMIYIPKGTPHAVKVRSLVPLKVVSIQSPFFDGSDRVLLE